MNPEYQKVCQECGECCKSIVLQVRKPELPKEKMEHIEFFNTRGLKILREFNKIMDVSIPLSCPHLNFNKGFMGYPDNYSCNIYGNHPEVCKKFDGRIAPAWYGLKCKLKGENA